MHTPPPPPPPSPPPDVKVPVAPLAALTPHPVCMSVGILFSKVNLNDCDEVLPAAMADLKDLLSRQGTLQAFLHPGPTQQGSEHVLLQLAVLSMFSMHDLAGASGDQQLR